MSPTQGAPKGRRLGAEKRIQQFRPKARCSQGPEDRDREVAGQRAGGRGRPGNTPPLSTLTRERALPSLRADVTISCYPDFYWTT